MAVALTALVVAMGGTSYAALSISGSSLKNGTVTGVKLKKNTLTGTQVNEAKLAKVPSAKAADTAKTAKTASLAATATNAGTAAQATNATNAATAANASALGGSPPAAYFQYGGPVPPGRTLTGVWGCAEIDTDTDTGATPATSPSGNVCRDFISLPVPAPTVLTDANVNLATGTVDGVAPLDGVAGECTGTAEAPTAPPGHVCAYTLSKIDSTDVTTYGAGGYGMLNAGSRFGFIIGVTVIGPKTKIGAEGTWAYTAPS
jgi:hypothetical protein